MSLSCLGRFACHERKLAAILATGDGRRLPMMAPRTAIGLCGLLALAACAENRPYHAHSGGQPATIGCGADIRPDLMISRAADGTTVYDAATLSAPCGAGRNEVRVDPGEYFVSFSACGYKSACTRVFARLTLLAGHRYGAYADTCFGVMCAVEGHADAPSYQTWAWIEDESTGQVVAGTRY